jgi:hypothetical protein
MDWLKELLIKFEDQEVLIVEFDYGLWNFVKGELSNENSIGDYNRRFKGIIQRLRIGDLFLRRIENQLRIRGNWRTEIEIVILVCKIGWD